LEKISFAYAKRACFVFIQDEVKFPLFLLIFHKRMQQSDKITYIAKALVNMKGLRALMMDFH